MEMREIKEILNELSASKNDVFSIDVQINKRLTKTLGRVKSMVQGDKIYPTLMEFSKEMLDTVTREDIISVIRHEWAHYYLAKTTEEDHGHDRYFKAICEEIGCHGTTTIKVEHTVEKKSKYVLYCKECGEIVAEYNRRCKTVNEYEYYTSKCCGAGLRLIENQKKIKSHLQSFKKYDIIYYKVKGGNKNGKD